MKKFVVSGGGTGGHIYPAIAIAKMLYEKYPGCDITYIGGETGMESHLVPREGIEFKGISAAGFKRKVSLEIFKTIAKTGAGYFQSRKFLKKYKPDLVIGTGGYVSAPVLFAANSLGIPTMIHEQNVYPGMANRMLSKDAKVVAISWEESAKHFKHPNRAYLTGNPIRADFFCAKKDESRKKLGLSQNLPIVLIFGGSQGALHINKVAIDAANDIVKANNAQVVLITGNAKKDEIMALAEEKEVPYRVFEDNAKFEDPGLILVPYMYDMAAAMAACDIAVCRSGAITLAELTAIGIPSILIPHPFVPDNVQEKNARALEDKKAAIVVLDGELNKENLATNIHMLLSDDERLALMRASSYECGMRDSIDKIEKCVEKALC